MEQKEQKTIEKQSKVILTNQSAISVSGISKVLSSTETNISVVINGQVMNIEGEKLSVSKLDVQNGFLDAEGHITAIKYSKSKQKENFFKRIFGWCCLKHFYKAKFFCVAFILEFWVELFLA